MYLHIYEQLAITEFVKGRFYRVMSVCSRVVQPPDLGRVETITSCQLLS